MDLHWNIVPDIWENVNIQVNKMYLYEYINFNDK